MGVADENLRKRARPVGLLHHFTAQGRFERCVFLPEIDAFLAEQVLGCRAVALESNGEWMGFRSATSLFATTSCIRKLHLDWLIKGQRQMSRFYRFDPLSKRIAGVLNGKIIPTVTSI